MMTMMIGMMTMMMMVIKNDDGYVMKRCREGKGKSLRDIASVVVVVVDVVIIIVLQLLTIV